MKVYDTVIFDLDGTLLNTLEDLTDSVNYALERAGLPLRSIDEVRKFVGNGVQRLMELALPQGADTPDFEKIFSLFREHYFVHCNDKTGPYPHIMKMLEQLNANGYKLAIVSNKYYEAVQELKNLYFADYISVAIGEKEGICRKPAPDTVEEALRVLGSEKSHAIYVGDSEVDIATAQNAGMECISVTWGFRTMEEQKRAGGRIFANDPMDILNLLHSL